MAATVVNGDETESDADEIIHQLEIDDCLWTQSVEDVMAINQEPVVGDVDVTEAVAEAVAVPFYLLLCYHLKMQQTNLFFLKKQG